MRQKACGTDRIAQRDVQRPTRHSATATSAFGKAGGQARFEPMAKQARIVQQIFSWIGRDHCSGAEVCRRRRHQVSMFDYSFASHA